MLSCDYPALRAYFGPVKTGDTQSGLGTSAEPTCSSADGKHLRPFALECNCMCWRWSSVSSCHTTSLYHTRCAWFYPLGKKRPVTDCVAALFPGTNPAQVLGDLAGSCGPGSPRKPQQGGSDNARRWRECSVRAPGSNQNAPIFAIITLPFLLGLPPFPASVL